MEHVQSFLRTVLSDKGYTCLTGIKGPNDIKNFYYTSVEVPLEKVQELQDDGYNVYVTPGTFTEKKRKRDLTKHVKSFFLDIDCGHGKVSYPDVESGLQALKQFCDEVGLPMPTVVVHSGRGIHTYWVLDKAVDYATWKPVAEQLKRACKLHGFKADPTVPADSARLMRLPGTLNYNADPPVPSYLMGARKFRTPVPLEKITTPLSKLNTIGFVKPEGAKLPRPVNILGSMHAEKSFKKLISLTKKGRGCNQIKYSLENPNDLSYAQWIHMLSIIKFCDDTGRDDLHKASKGYDYYNEEETDKISESLNYPHTCDSFSDDFEAGCEGCPHRHKIASPITLAMKIKEAEDDEVISVQGDVFSMTKDSIKVQNIPEYPKPYFRKEGGGVYIRKSEKGKDGDEVIEEQILPTDLYFTRRILDPVTGPSFVIKHHTHREGVKEFVLSSATLSVPRECGIAMCKEGVHIIASDAGDMVRYSKAWINKLTKTVDEEKATIQFGWNDKHNPTSFAVGKRLITKDSIEDNPPTPFTHQYFSMLEPVGTLGGYKNTLQCFNLPDMELHQFMIGLAFGAPLMIFADKSSGCIYNIFNQESGYGKSTAMYAGASTWGNPRHLVLTGSSTSNSVWNRVQRMRHIAVYVDELSNLEGKQASELAYAVSQGQEKSRMSNHGQNMERVKGEPWDLLVGSSANMSMVQKVQDFRYTPQAEEQRILEAMATLKMESKDVATILNRSIDNNYGQAGIDYIQHLLQDIDKHRDGTRDSIATLSNLIGSGNENRNWDAMVGTVMYGLRVAQEMGLHMWDLDKLQEWVVAHIKRLRNNIKANSLDIREIIADFYFAHLGSVLEVKSTQKGVVRMDRIPNQLAMRFEPDTGVLSIVRSVFRTWASSKNLVIASLESMMENEMGMERKQVRLAKNTNMDFGPQHCYVLKYSEADLTKRVQRAKHKHEVKTNPDYTN